MSSFHKSLRMICVAGMLVGGLAVADTVNLTTVTVVKTSSSQNLSSSASLGFNPGSSKISFQLGSKTCTFNSSGNPFGAGGGAGCNYSLTYNVSTGEISNPQSNGNGCTAANQMVAACK